MASLESGEGWGVVFWRKSLYVSLKPESRPGLFPGPLSVICTALLCHAPPALPADTSETPSVP